MWVRCPRCATVIEAKSNPLVCPSCGFQAALPTGAPSAGTPAGPSPSPTAYAPPPQWAPAPGSAGPVGKTRGPGVTVVLGAITLSVYFLFWYWKITKEVDAFVQKPRFSHGRLRVSYLFGVLGLVAVLGAVVAFLASDTFEQETPTIGAAFLGGVLLVLLAFGALITASVLLYMALWRVWTSLEADDKRRGEPQPTNSVLLLVFVLMGAFIPYVGFVFGFVAIYLTQKSLNRTWAVYAAAPRPASAV